MTHNSLPKEPTGLWTSCSPAKYLKSLLAEKLFLRNFWRNLCCITLFNWNQTSAVRNNTAKYYFEFTQTHAREDANFQAFKSIPEINSAHRVNECVRVLCLRIHWGVLGQLQADGVIQPLLEAHRPRQNNVSEWGTGNSPYFKDTAPQSVSGAPIK